MNTDSDAMVIDGSTDLYDILKGLNSTRDLAEKIRTADILLAERKRDKAENEEIKVADLPVSKQAEEIAYGEYYNKPYDQERLTELTEMNQRLKSCINTMGTCCARLGLVIQPSKDRRIADMSKDEISRFKNQKEELLLYLNNISEDGTMFEEYVAGLIEAKFATGDGYLEVVENMKGAIVGIYPVIPKYIYIKRDDKGKPDGYIQIYQGTKTYFKKFGDKRIINANTGKEDKTTKISERATSLLHYKQRNLLSKYYGVPLWSASIPSILGCRYAEERNAAFFDNDSVPRMAVLVMGGALDEITVETTKKFFRQGKGKENYGRVLVMQASSKNANNPDAKPPIIKLEPLTVGKTDDQSFGKYQRDSKETIREAFRIASIFFGTSDDVNRAAAYTMREMTIAQVFAPESKSASHFINSTIVRKWATGKGYVTLDSNGKVKDDSKLEVQIGFHLPETMSEKDKADMFTSYASAGGLSCNDIRDILNLPRIDKDWANIPQSLAVVMMQMQTLEADKVDMGYDFTDATLDQNLTKAIGYLKFLVSKQMDPFNILSFKRKAGGDIEDTE